MTRGGELNKENKKKPKTKLNHTKTNKIIAHARAKHKVHNHTITCGLMFFCTTRYTLKPLDTARLSIWAKSPSLEMSTNAIVRGLHCKGKQTQNKTALRGRRGGEKGREIHMERERGQNVRKRRGKRREEH